MNKLKLKEFKWVELAQLGLGMARSLAGRAWQDSAINSLMVGHGLNAHAWLGYGSWAWSSRAGLEIFKHLRNFLFQPFEK